LAEYVFGTICGAAATGAVGIIRVSGPEAFAAAFGLYRGRAERFENRRIYYGMIAEGDETLDEALFLPMRAPGTYTTEDVVEIQCHGGQATLARVMAALTRRGVRLAEPGEFTRRAYLGGRVDLARAEAVMDIVGAKTDASRRAAFGMLSGGLSEAVRRVSDGVLDTLAAISAAIDFPDEIGADDLSPRVAVLSSRLDELIASAENGSILRDGLSAAVIGRPNAGKSSIWNALLGADRAIVSPIPGTTRDALREWANIGGIPVLLTDTAGIRETDDEIEREGARRAERAADEARLVLAVIDASRETDPADPAFRSLSAGKNTVILLNKIDLPEKTVYNDIIKDWPGARVMRVSAATGEGMDELRRAVTDAAGLPSDAEPFSVSARQKNALVSARECLARAERTLAEGLSGEFAAIDLTECRERLGEITGETLAEDVIDRIFENFCLGK
jgi:tRNA modification GTPase